MSETKHSPEPWVLGWQHEAEVQIWSDKPSVYVASAFGDHPKQRVNSDIMEANARRIVACVNACAGIPTGILEVGGIKTLIDCVALIFYAEGSGGVAELSTEEMRILLRKLGRLS